VFANSFGCESAALWKPSSGGAASDVNPHQGHGSRYLPALYDVAEEAPRTCYTITGCILCSQVCVCELFGCESAALWKPSSGGAASDVNPYQGHGSRYLPALYDVAEEAPRTCYTITGCILCSQVCVCGLFGCESAALWKPSSGGAASDVNPHQGHDSRYLPALYDVAEEAPRTCYTITTCMFTPCILCKAWLHTFSLIAHPAQGIRGGKITSALSLIPWIVHLLVWHLFSLKFAEQD